MTFNQVVPRSSRGRVTKEKDEFYSSFFVIFNKTKYNQYKNYPRKLNLKKPYSCDINADQDTINAAKEIGVFITTSYVNGIINIQMYNPGTIKEKDLIFNFDIDYDFDTTTLNSFQFYMTSDCYTEDFYFYAMQYSTNNGVAVLKNDQVIKNTYKARLQQAVIKIKAKEYIEIDLNLQEYTQELLNK